MALLLEIGILFPPPYKQKILKCFLPKYQILFLYFYKFSQGNLEIYIYTYTQKIFKIQFTLIDLILFEKENQ